VSRDLILVLRVVRCERRTSLTVNANRWHALPMASTLRSCWRRDAHRGGRSRSRPLPRMPSRTVAAGPTCGALVTAVISSPDLGVFAVTAAAPGLRRGHIICSGVLAVAAVTAVGVSCPGPARWLVRRVRLKASRAHWSALRRRLIAAGRNGPGRPDGWAFWVTVKAPIVRTRDGQGLPRWPGRRGGDCRVARIAQAPGRPASGSIPPAPGSPARGRGPVRGQRARALGLRRAHQAEDATAGPR
jgi:hypothetical protein